MGASVSVAAPMRYYRNVSFSVTAPKRGGVCLRKGIHALRMRDYRGASVSVKAPLRYYRGASVFVTAPLRYYRGALVSVPARLGH